MQPEQSGGAPRTRASRASKFTDWWERRKVLSELDYQREVAEATAKIAMAPSKVKAEIEWDLRWMSPLDKTWRDEIIVIVWSVPFLGSFLPWTKDYVAQGFELLKTLSPEAPSMFMWGWLIIFGSVFGMKQLKQWFQPGRLAPLVKALAEARDDVSDTELGTAQDAVSPSSQPLSNGDTEHE